MERALRIEPATMSPATDTFESFYRVHYTRLAQAMLLLTRNEVIAEDLAQEACARVLARWERVRTMESPEGYLYRTALNVFRRRSRRRPAPTDSSVTVSPDHAVPIAERDRILRALDTLPRGQREALVLVDWLDMSTEDAGRILGLKPAAVRVRLHRGRNSLRADLGGPNE